MEILLGVILGWLFGLLGQRPISYIQNSIKKPAIQKSIVAELKELRCRLAMTSYLLADRTGELDKIYLMWIQPILKTYDGFCVDMKMAENLEKLLALKEEVIESFIEIKKSQIDKSKGLSLKIFSIPVIDENHNNLHLFDMKFQKDILEIRGHIYRLNEEIENSRFYFQKTFDSNLSENNSEIIKNNLEQSYRNINRALINISDYIGAISGCNLTTG